MPESDTEPGRRTSLTGRTAPIEGSKSPKNITRVLYANKNNSTAIASDKIVPEDGEPITADDACDLKQVVWGGADKALGKNWLKLGLTFHPEGKIFSYGMMLPKNDTKNFMMCLQAYFIKNLLFAEDEASKKDSKKPNKQRYTRKKAPKEDKLTDDVIEKRLKPKFHAQKTMIVEGILDVIFKAAGGENGVFCLPGENHCFDPPSRYLNDNYTEKLRLFTCAKKEDMRPVILGFYDYLIKEGGLGCLCLLYSIVLSRGTDKIKEDMQDKADRPLIDLGQGECNCALLILVISGQATPYVHNAIAKVGDAERKGIGARNDIGLLVSTESTQLPQQGLPTFTKDTEVGAYLKTPFLPIWLTHCDGQMGVLFNPNVGLLKNKGLENRFNLYYYANFEFDKKDVPKQTILTIDSRVEKKDEEVDFDLTEYQAPLLETAISTKWEGAGIDWDGVEPYVW